VGFLFAFSLVALPVFIWLKRESGKRFLASLTRMADWRGGLMVFVILPVLARFVLQPFFPGEHDWSDFVYLLLFFVSGYIIISEERFTQAIRRDWLLYLILGVASTLFFFSSAAGVPIFEWAEAPGTLGFYLIWIVFSLNSWSWTMFVFYIGMGFLDFANDRLGYAREASYPFFFVHQPVIIFIAFFVVQWQVGLLIKILVVLIGSFVLSLGIYEFLIRRINPVRALFGMKPRRP
jgi:hypothetical protein